MKRTHVGNIHRRAEVAGQTDQYAEATDPSGGWGAPIATAVKSNLQPLTGSVQDTQAGRAVGANWKGFFPASVDIREGDGYVVTSGPGPRDYRVQQVGPQGGPWDTEVLLATTPEQIGP